MIVKNCQPLNSQINTNIQLNVEEERLCEQHHQYFEMFHVKHKFKFVYLLEILTAARHSNFRCHQGTATNCHESLHINI